MMADLWCGLRHGVLKQVQHGRGRVAFIHINRTGGTSVERALQTTRRTRSSRAFAADLERFRYRY